MTLNDAYRCYLRKYDTPHNDFHINLVRIFVGLFFAWKTMSRDFGFMGLLPHDFFYFYPIHIYKPDGIVLITGLPYLMELATFHWIHWIVGFPSEALLAALGFVLVGLSLLMAFAGRGPFRIFAIATYGLATYLWGFIFLSGQEVDSVMIYFGMLLVVCLANYDDRPVWHLGTLADQQVNVQAGRAFSSVLMVFVIYYGLSGYNKITDLRIIDWFNYNLIQDIQVTLKMQELGNYYGTLFPRFFSLFIGYEWLNYLLVPLVYLSHLTVGAIFFKRNYILKFAAFYSAFHFFASSVSIAFTGYFIVWWILIDWRKILWFVRRRDVSIVAV